MKIRVVSSREEIETLTNKEEVIHLTFRPKRSDIFNIVLKCYQNLKAIHIPPSYARTMAESCRRYLEMQDIELLEGDVCGHRKDISDYSEVPQSTYDRIKKYRSKGLSNDEIEIRMGRETGYGPDFIRFLLKENN